jgi:hypothetical protein
MSRLNRTRRLAIGATLVGIATIGLWATSAPAEEPYPWCAEYNGDDGPGGVNCGFETLAQCRATISGIGGNCYENPAFHAPARRPKKKTPRSH